MSKYPKETGILYKADLIPLILAGTKTMTRRVIKLKPHPTGHEWHAPFYHDGKWIFTAGWGLAIRQQAVKCPYGGVGDLLWIRKNRFTRKVDTLAWQEIIGLRVERLQEITNADALKEGQMPAEEYRDEPFPLNCKGVITGFAILWDKINAKRGLGWSSNCWVWVIEAKVIKRAE